jgi:glutaredoxin-like protein
MAFIDEQDQKSLRTMFAERLQGDVTLTYFTQGALRSAFPGQECMFCKETRQLLHEVAALADPLHLEVKDFLSDAGEAQRLGVTRIPAVVVQGRTKGQVRFFGIPSGYEFSTLIDDLIAVSTGINDLSASTRAALQAIDRDVHIQVFVTPTCPYCPFAAGMAHKLAMENPHITADVIEITEFPELAQRYDVRGVPKIVVNESITFEGAVPEERFVREVLRAVEPATASASAGR